MVTQKVINLNQALFKQKFCMNRFIKPSFKRKRNHAMNRLHM